MWLQFTRRTHFQIPFISYPKRSSKVRLMHRIKNTKIYLAQIATSPVPKHNYRSLITFLNSALTRNVTPRFLVLPDWRIQTKFEARDYILGLFTCFFFFFRIKILYTKMQNKTTTGVVSIKIYTYILSPIYLYTYKNNISITYSERKTYCDEPLLVCWLSCMRMFSDVFFCTYTD